MGTWCGDSKREVPRFYKILDEMGVKEQDIQLYNLDNRGDAYKQSPGGEEKGQAHSPGAHFYRLPGRQGDGDGS